MHLSLGFWVTWIIALVGWMIQYIRLSSPEIPQETYSQVFSQNVSLGFILLAGIIVSILF